MCLVAKSFITITSILVSIVAAMGQTPPDYDLPPVNYSKAKDNNRITRLQAALEEQRFAFPDSNGKAILKALSSYSYQCY